MRMRTFVRLWAALLIATALLLAHPAATSAQQPALVYDTEFAITFALADTVEHGDGTVTLPFDFAIRNDTGAAVSHVTLALSSPLVREQETGTVAVGAMAAGATASAAGSFTMTDPGIEDGYFLLSVLWKVEYDDASGVHCKRYVKGTY